MLHDWQDDEDRDLARTLPPFIMSQINSITTSRGKQRIVLFNIEVLQAYLKEKIGYIPKVFK